MRDDYADPRHHVRLMAVLRQRLGHALAGLAEEAKIAVAQGGAHEIDLFEVEDGLVERVTEAQAVDAIHHDLDRIVHAARETVLLAGLHVAEIDAVYFTGGSTGLGTLARRLAGAFPHARAVHGDRFASVATGLGLEARRRLVGPSTNAPAGPARAGAGAGANVLLVDDRTTLERSPLPGDSSPRGSGRTPQGARTP